MKVDMLYPGGTERRRCSHTQMDLAYEVDCWSLFLYVSHIWMYCVQQKVCSGLILKPKRHNYLLHLSLTLCSCSQKDILKWACWWFDGQRPASSHCRVALNHLVVQPYLGSCWGWRACFWRRGTASISAERKKDPAITSSPYRHRRSSSSEDVQFYCKFWHKLHTHQQISEQWKYSQSLLVSSLEQLAYLST